MIRVLRTWMAGVFLVPELAGAERRHRRGAYVLQVGQARMIVDTEHVADKARRRELSAWLARIDRLLVGEQRVDVEWSVVRVTHRRGEQTVLHWDGVTAPALFDLVASALGATHSRVTAARKMRTDSVRPVPMKVEQPTL